MQPKNYWQKDNHKFVIRFGGVCYIRPDNALIDAIKTAPYLVITVQIDKKKYLDKYTLFHYDPYHYCLRCLVERFVLYCRRWKAKGLVVIEPRCKKSDKKLKASYELIFKKGTEYIRRTLAQRLPTC